MQAILIFPQFCFIDWGFKSAQTENKSKYDGSIYDVSMSWSIDQSFHRIINKKKLDHRSVKNNFQYNKVNKKSAACFPWLT
jgi:hypothetical protein